MALTRASAAVIKTEEIVNNRNLIINGDMRIAQRGTSNTGMTGSAAGPASYHTVDRWGFQLSTGAGANQGTWTMNVENSGPINTEFSKGNSVNLICTTANTSPPSTNFMALAQRLEGLNVQGIKKGTIEAESITVSFWVKSSNTGTYILEAYDIDNTRSCSKAYTINTADTWEKKTITFPPDTTGQFDNDNGASLQISFWQVAGSVLGSGTLQTTWGPVISANRLAGQLNLANRVGNYWAVTGVQLEVGSVATPFERRPYGTELSLCQRYYYKVTTDSAAAKVLAPNGFADSTTTAFCWTQFPVEMRTSPSALQQTGTAANYEVRYTGGNSASCSSVPTFNVGSTWGARSIFTVASGLTGGQAVALQTVNAAGIFLAWSAEL